MAIEVKLAEDKELGSWNVHVENSPHSSTFHLLEWLRLVEKHQNCKLLPFLGYRGDEVIGLFPVFFQKKGPIKAIFSPPPRSGIAYLGPIMLNFDDLKQDKREHNFKEFIDGVDSYLVNNLKVKYIIITTSLDLIDVRPLQWAGYSTVPVYSYILDLTKGSEHIWNNFKKELRKNIKNCEKKGITVAQGKDLSDVKFIFDTQVERYKEQKMRYPLKWDYLKNIFTEFKKKNLLKIFIAKEDDEKVSGIISIIHQRQKRISLWVGATGTRNITGLYPNDLIQWSIIKWGIDNKLNECEIIGAADPNISYFKSRYNPAVGIKFSCKKGTLGGKFAESLYTKLKHMEIL